MKPQFYRMNYSQSHPTHNRASYYYVRSQIRRLRRDSPQHMDVLWYQQSLGIVPYTTEVTRREAYCWQTKAWYTVGRMCRPRLHSCLRIAVNAPVNRLP